MRLKIRAQVAIVLDGEESHTMRAVAEVVAGQGDAGTLRNPRTRKIAEQFAKSMATMGRFHEMVAKFHRKHEIEGPARR